VALPAGRITMLFSDIEGSTRLLLGLGDRYTRVLSDQRAIIRAAIAAHGGHEMGTEGDSFFVVFSSAFSAVTAAVDAQRALAAHPWPLDGTVRVRMGIETGEPVRHEDGYAGIDLHRAARIAGTANGGQVVLGVAAQRDVADLLPPDVTLRDLGLHRLKDLPGAEQLFQVVVNGLTDITTPVKSLGAPSNLPRLPAPLVGREDEIAATLALLASSARLVTLTGPGGVGKTSLALAVATRVEQDYRDGVYFVALEEARTSDAAWDALAGALGVATDEKPQQAVVAYSAGRSTLLVLDNLEQLDGAATIARALIDRTGCTILATSRGPLRLRAEHEIGIAPFGAPQPGMAFERLATTPAVELFVREAQRARASFALSAENAPHVVAICAPLEGLPLAIELAAAQVRLLGPEAVAKSVEQRLSLASRESDRPGRQRTLAATIAWSVELLSRDDRRCFEWLGVFAGGAGLAAVAAVLPGDRSGADALMTIEALADVSLVSIGEGPAGEPRLAMLGLVRDAALLGLQARGELQEARRRHAEHYVVLAEEAEPRLRGPDAFMWTDRLGAEQDNLRDAFEWSLASGTPDGRLLALRLATALGWYWYTHGRATEGRARIEAAIGDGTGLDAATFANALHVLGVLEQQQGGNERAIAAFETSLAVWRVLNDSRGIARELNSLGVAHWAQGEPLRSRLLLEESAEVARDAGDEQRLAAAMSNLGILDLSTDAPDRAIAAFEEALAIDTRRTDRWAIAVDHCNLGAALACAGRLDDAKRTLVGTMRTVVELGDNDLLASALEACALLAGASDDHERAVVLLSGAESLRRAAEIPLTPLEHALLERVLDPACAALGQDRYNTLWERGQRLAIDDLVAEALPSS
jgi:predicted ATPase